MWVMKIFSVQFFCVFFSAEYLKIVLCILARIILRIFFLIPYASVRSIPFLRFIEPIIAWNIPLISLIFLRSLVFPILLLSFISLHQSLRKAFLSLLAILWNSAFKWIYLSFSPLLFTAIYKASLDNHFVFLHFFFLEMVLITASCTMSWTFIHSYSVYQI